MFFLLVEPWFSFVFNHNIIGNQNWKTFTRNFCFWHRVALSISGLAEAILAGLGYVSQAGLSGSREKARFLAANHIPVYFWLLQVGKRDYDNLKQAVASQKLHHY